MLHFILYISLAAIASLYAAVRYFKVSSSLKTTAPQEYEITIYSLKELFGEFLIRRLIPLFIFVFIFAVFIFFIRKDFSFILIYGSLLFFIFLSADVFISFNLLKIIYPFVFSDKRYLVRDIFVVSKLFVVFAVYSALILLYFKKGIDFDYPVIFLGAVFLSFLAYSAFEKRYSKIVYFITSSSISLIMILTALFGLKYLMPSDVRYVFDAISVFFICAMINEAASVFLPDNYKKYYFKIPFGLSLTLFYPAILFYMSYHSYSNLFFVLPAAILYFSMLFVFVKGDVFERYYAFMSFFIIIFFFFLSKMFYIFNTSMNYERFVIFNLMLLIPFFYLTAKHRDYNYLVYFIQNNSSFERIECDVVSFKNMFLLAVLSSGLGFKIAYDYLVLYFGYSDSYSFFSVVIAVFFFYVFDLYSDNIFKRFNNLFVDSLFSLSVITFIYSASLVICSYTFGINFTNLVSCFCLYAFLTLMFSSKYISYLTALVYLSVTYLIIYV